MTGGEAWLAGKTISGTPRQRDCVTYSYVRRLGGELPQSFPEQTPPPELVR
ncbi:MAG: hypothetical protein FWC97_06690 [Treponema sp.]|nr:hypothetical protein [Treponema sp.]